MGVSRRSAIKLSSLLPFAFMVPNPLDNKLSSNEHGPRGLHAKSLRLGIIGFGIRGEQLLRAAGFPTKQWIEENREKEAYHDYLNQENLNVTITGVCDLFDVRASKALKASGVSARRFRNYKELISAQDVDAVIIATPDHMHAPMIIEAARNGKDVYVEKCLTHRLEEVEEVYQVVKTNKITFQLGHQLRQKDTYHKAKDILYLDVLGKVSLIQSSTNRNTPDGAWIYDIPLEANESNIDWAQFDSKNEFDLDRFFRWRKYWDYGTGLAGDLFTHEYDSLNAIMELGIPHSAMASGGIYYYQDGREVPDVFQASFEYPKFGLTLLYSATLSNDATRETMVMGSDATMYLGNNIKIFPCRNSKKYANKLASGIMKTESAFYEYPTKNENLDSVDAVSGATTQYFQKKGMMSTYRNGRKLDPTHLHIMEWLLCIRNGWDTSCNIEAAYQEAIVAHMATISYRKGKKVVWDETEKRVKW